MALNFPDSPTNGDTTTLNGVVYTYDSTKTVWVSTTGAGGSSVTVSDTAPTSPSDGDQWFNSSDLKLYIRYNDGATSQWVIAAPAGAAGSDGADGTDGTAGGDGRAGVYADMAALIAKTGMVAGDTALVTALNKVFMYTGTAWFLIATMVNDSPTAITGVAATTSLAIDGTASVITAVSTDPEGFPLTWSYAVTTGSLGSTATVSQADNVFTITPSTTEADAGEFSLTFSVTDGATGAVNAVSAFTLAFYTFTKPTPNTEYTYGSHGAPTIYAQTANDIEFTMPCLGASFQSGRTTMSSLILPFTGKLYFEMQCTWATDIYAMWTFTKYDWSTQPSAGTPSSYGWVYSGQLWSPTQASGPTITNSYTGIEDGALGSTSTATGTEERIGVAIDHTNNEWWFRKGQSAWSWGDPTTAGSGYDCSTAGTAEGHIHFFLGNGSGTGTKTRRIKFFDKDQNNYAVPTGYSSM
jgi:hypothetical protein